LSRPQSQRHQHCTYFTPSVTFHKSVGPVAAGIDATLLDKYTGGVIDNDAPYQIDHIVSIVGYDTDAKTGQDYWIGE
jgi:hypothetical protein